MNDKLLLDRLVQHCLLLTSQMLGRVIAEGEYLSHAAVHDIRVATKQLRSAWRLLANVAPEPAAAARARLRALHHFLASGRQRLVLRATLAHLHGKCHGDRDRAVLQHLLDALPETPGVLIGRGTAENVGVSFRAESRAWRELALDAGQAALTAALVRSYRSARRASKRAGRERSLEAFHRLRQRVKRLLYQIDLVFEAPPDGIAAMLTDMARAAYQLGQLQDLNDLHAHVVATVEDDAARRRVRRLLRERVRKRVRRIGVITAAAFAASPAAFGAALSGASRAVSARAAD